MYNMYFRDRSYTVRVHPCVRTCLCVRASGWSIRWESTRNALLEKHIKQHLTCYWLQCTVIEVRL